MPENKIRYGLCNVHYAKATVSEDGKVTYDVPVKIPGAVSLSIKPVGSSNPFYADNIEYFNVITNNGYDGDIEIANIPDSFRTDILKEALDETDKVLTENADNVASEYFALLYQFEGDVKARRHVLYYCNAQRPEQSGKTKNDKTEPDTEKLTISARPRPDTLDVKASTTEDTPQAVYDAWFTAVYEKAVV
jgi:phi13 family phage major tail protein